MKYAVVEIGGKQILVEEGRYFFVNNLPHKIGSALLLNRVLLCNDNGRRIVGYPYIVNQSIIQVTATILEHGRGPKISVFKMKPKKKYRVMRGHRQPITKIIIDKIETQ